jgi:hypothetical protein
MDFSRSSITAAWITLLACAVPVVGNAQTPDPVPLDVMGKLRYHALYSFGPRGIAGSAAWAGFLQAIDSPEEWEQGAKGYGKRFASSMGASAIYCVLAFGLDSTLHQDPRYFRSGKTGFWRRARHAVRGTFLTRKDGGGETLAIWRFGSDYGSAFLSNEWYPDRLNTVGLGLLQGTAQVGLDLGTNLGKEFWPDIKRKIFHR